MGSIVYFPIFYSPALQKITSMGICATIGAYVLFYRTKTSINKYRLLSLLLAMGGYYLFALYSYSGLNYILMVLLSVFFSWAIYRNTVLIEYFTRQKFTVTEILAIRSWILLIVSYLFAHHLHQVISFAAICFKIQEISIIVSTISFVLVSYLLQKAIEASGNVKTNIINGVIPLVTFIMQLTLIRHLASIDELVTSILITLIIIGFAVLSSKYKA
ncbi:MAG: hypothetical protein ORN24_06795 [Burkholderiales bacterium]|nr:hypothetical protein [Burkholderiales bacterium]